MLILVLVFNKLTKHIKMDLWLNGITETTNYDFILPSKSCQCHLETKAANVWDLVHRGVTRLNGARDKKQVWRPHDRTRGLSEANVLYWRIYVWHCWDFSAPPAVIRHSMQWFGAPTVIRRPGNYAPFAPIVTTLLVQMINDAFNKTLLVFADFFTVNAHLS